MSDPTKEPDALLATPEVLKRLAIGETTLWRLEKKGQFPKPVFLGRCKRWRASDIDAFIAAAAGSG